MRPILYVNNLGHIGSLFLLCCCVLTSNNLKSPVSYCRVLLPVYSVDSQDEEYKSRWRSIRIMYFTMFLSSVGEDAHDLQGVLILKPVQEVCCRDTSLGFQQVMCVWEMGLFHTKGLIIIKESLSLGILFCNLKYIWHPCWKTNQMTKSSYRY